MAVSLKHKFVSLLPDGPSPGHVQASHWNADHALTLSAGSLLGNSSGSTGDAEEITIGSGLLLTDGTLSATASLGANIDGGNAAALFGGSLFSIDGGNA